MIVSIIVAIAENNAIGKDNDLLWYLPEDLKKFKTTTTGHTIIMGRKTFESIGKPLPNRRSIIITRNVAYKAPEGVEVVNSLEEALELCYHEKEVFVIGGGAIYKEALPLADKLYLTKVHASFEADIFFPQINEDEWEKSGEEKNFANDKNMFDTTFNLYERKENVTQHIQDMCKNTLVSHLDMEFIHFHKGRLVVRMPVNEKTIQPVGILHGGASLALLETVGSGLSVLSIPTKSQQVYGMSVTANHIKPAKKGYVYATASFLHKGMQTQVVNVEIKDEEGNLICDGRITNIIVSR